MCGICGTLRFDNEKINDKQARHMLDSIKMRGPDHTDTFSTENLYLGHSRLAVIDPSNKSHQPMKDDILNMVIVFNGVIYNYKELRIKLSKKGYNFFSDGDTEVILKSYHYYGRDCVKHFDGVFSFCIYDITNQQLFLSRDRLGIKPLYYKIDEMSFSFASNTAALCQNKDVYKIDDESLHYHFTLHSVVPAPKTILRDIFKLEPGSYAIINLKDKNFFKQSYYSFNSIQLNKKLKEGDIISSIEQLLIESIKKRFNTADVDVGVLLSGGLDSSLIVALAESINLSNINTYSIGFPSIEQEMGNEFYYSDLIANQFNTNHQKYSITSDHLFKALDDVIKVMPEPMSSQDSSAFYLLAKNVSLHQKVVMSGQGADELFGGYFWYENMMNTPGNDIDKFKVHYFDQDHLDYSKSINRKHISRDYTTDYIATAFSNEREDIGFIDKVLRLDLSTLIIDDPVKRVDSMTMASGLETRVPFLDIDLVEFVLSIPSSKKINNNGKYHLKKLAEKYLDNSMIYRDKFYFPVPPLKILKDKFLKYVSNILLSEQCADRGVYNRAYISKLLSKPNSCFTRLNGNKLWHLALFERWFQLNIDT